MHQLIAQQAPEEKPQSQDVLGDPSFVFLLGAIFIAAYFFLLRPMNQREKRERQELLTRLKKNDEVLTASGIIGIVAMIKDDEVVIKVDESSNMRLRMLKSAIVRILNPKDATAKSGQETPGSDNAKASGPPAK